MANLKKKKKPNHEALWEKPRRSAFSVDSILNQGDPYINIKFNENFTMGASHAWQSSCANGKFYEVQGITLLIL